MSAQLRPIGTIALVIALISTSVLALGILPNTALAVDCLTAPNSSAPPNSHWYYGTDRRQQRKCWHLRTDNAPSENGVPQTAREAPAKPSRSVAAGSPYPGLEIKDLVAQHGRPKLSDQDVEKLYAEFLEWKRHIKN